MRLLFLGCFLIFSSFIFGQQTIGGLVLDADKQPLPFATITLLDVSDSTFQYFGMTDLDGKYIIRGVANNVYLLQAALTGYETSYQTLVVNDTMNKVINIELAMAAKLLDGVSIEAERIPIRLNGDTLEYNSAAFRTSANANVEELLKKLPGVEVDDQGNIKVNGKTVQKVLVDGKEFFGNDPTIATKNIPADAINKVQVYEGKGDLNELTGYDDGTREQTINLTLKEDRKNSWIGEVYAGVGTDEHYKFGGKALRFAGKHQFSILGMGNDINDFGFGVKDYIDFNGGLAALGSGQITLDGDDIPVNFGQPIYGNNESIAGGVNYTYQKDKFHRFSINYLGSGVDRLLNETFRTRNILQNGEFNQYGFDNEQRDNQNHAIRLSTKWRLDTLSSIVFNASAGQKFLNALSQEETTTEFITPQQRLNAFNRRDQLQQSINTDATYVKRLLGFWSLFEASVGASYSKTIDNRDFTNNVFLFTDNLLVTNQQVLDNVNKEMTWVAGATLRKTLTKTWDASIGVNGRWNEGSTNRTQSPFFDEIDLVDVAANRNAQWGNVDIAFNRVKAKSQFRVSIQPTVYQWNGYDSKLEFLPNLTWRSDYAAGKSVNLNYSRTIDLPTSEQLVEYVNATNPQQAFKGNAALRPEDKNTVFGQWFFFDQFSFTGLFLSINNQYTRDKIVWARTIRDDGTQLWEYQNVDYDNTTTASVDFNRPLRAIKSNISLSYSPSWSSSITPINDIEVKSNTWTHSFEAKLDNRKKEKWDVGLGGKFEFGRSIFSNIDGSNDFTNLSYFAYSEWYPNKQFTFKLKGTVNNYIATDIGERQVIPILSGSIAYQLKKWNKWTLELEGFDLLDRNTGVTRFVELNSLNETNSNLISRYVMFSLRYRISVFN
jgi:hypothetical protein